ncbi:MAG: hypothetical protein RL432_1397 [Bacteroidota bacterium]|jgi:hypothetical protein
MEQPVYLSRVHKVTQLLWWCAGADAYFLNKSPMQDRVKYAGIGGIVLCTGLLACFSGGFAFYTIFGPKNNAIHDSFSWGALIGSIIFGVVWGLIILNLDRFIVSSTGKGDGTDKVTWKEFSQAIPRIIIALILGFAISAPLEIKILESEIDSELSAYQKEYARKLNAQTDILFKQNIAKLEKDKQEYEKKLSAYEAELKVYDDEIDALVDRQQTEMQDKRAYGFGPVAKKMQADIETKRSEKEKFIQLKSSEVASWRKQLDFADDQINKNADDLRQAYKDNEIRSHGYDGLLKRIQISHEIGGWIPWIIFGVFLCIEMGPIFFKMMLNKGPYDYMVENYNKLRQVEAGVVSESLLYESVNGMMHMEKYTYLDYETAKAEREEKMVKQKELNKQIIEAWNQHTSKDIQENPSKFFQNKDPQG